MTPSSTSISKTGWRFVRHSLGWAVMLLVFFEAGLRCLPEAQFSRVMEKRTQEMVQLPPAKIQIYGDSVTDGALNDKILASVTGLGLQQVRNVSLGSSSAFFALPLLKRQLAAGTAPEILVLGYNARSYSVPMVPKFVTHMAHWSEVADLALNLSPALEDVLKGMVGRVSFAYRYRSELNSIIRYRTGYEVFLPKVTPSLGVLERQALLPAAAADLPPESQSVEVSDFASGFSNGAFLRLPVMERSLEQLIDLACLHGIRVWIVSMPKPPAAQALHDQNGFNEAYDHLLGELDQRSGVEILLRKQDTLPAAAFMDAVHLTRAAGIMFSQKVGHLMKTSLGQAGEQRIR